MTNKNLAQHREHQRLHRQRAKQGLLLSSNPWSWLTLADVQKLASDAYKVASFTINQESSDYDFARSREMFADELAHRFSHFVAVAAADAGMSVQVVKGCGPNETSTIDYARELRESVEHWRPQYPVYQKLTPASAANASGVVTTIDEGNRNARNSNS